MPLRVKFVDAIDDIDRESWNQLRDPNVPFLRHEYLAALEHSLCVSASTGWEPKHFALYDQGGALIAVAPQYIKHHSYGEYVFDWAWADFYQQYGQSYYPKLLNAIPFTPSTSSRLLLDRTRLHDDDSLAAIVASYLKENIQYCDTHQLSSWHVLFPSNCDAGGGHGNGYAPLLKRAGVQFHWYNRAYTCFDDFLLTLRSRKRKNIRKERQRIVTGEFQFEFLAGDQISKHDLATFYQFYQATYLKRGQQGYLNQAFFEEILTTMPEDIRLLMVSDGDKAVAGALFFIGTSSLYGRYWGCLEEYDSLHFETCYYQGIEYCIQHGLRHFDAGAQGEHKVLRGFEPVDTASFHWIQDPQFRAPIDRFLQQEKLHIEQYKEGTRQCLPYKNEATLDQGLNKAPDKEEQVLK